MKKSGKYENIVKDYFYASDMQGYRQLIFEVSDANKVLDSDGNVVGDTDSLDESTISQNSYQTTEDKVNSDDAKITENYRKSKEIIEKRLKKLGVDDYSISMNEETGKIFLKISENDETDHVVSNLLQVGKFEIRDSENQEQVYIKNSDLKKAKSVYNTTESGTTVYLQLELDKEGRKTFANLTENEYKKVENNTTNNSTNTEENATTEENSDTTNTESTENTESKEENKQKQIVLAIDNNKMVTTSFDEPIKDGIIDLSMGKSSKDSDEISKLLKSTSTIATILNSGEMPLSYKVMQNQFVKENTSDKNIVYIGIAILAIMLIVLCIKFKTKGIAGTIGFLGFIALYLLLIRYTNVKISIESIAGIVVVILINYFTQIKLLRINEPDDEIRKKEFTKEYKSFISIIVPVAVIAVVFTFMSFERIATYGMVTFWGVILVLLYNLLVTRKIIEIK